MKFIKPQLLLKRLLDAGVGKEPKMRPRLLGVDFGTVCTGLSFTDSTNRHGFPITVLDMKKENISQHAAEIKKQIRERNIYGIVFGFPLIKGKPEGGKPVGKSSKTGAKVLNWVSQLEASEELRDMDIEYTYWDESFTTKGVKAKLSEDIIPGLRDAAVNQHASGFIVESLLTKLDHVRVAWENGEKVDEGDYECICEEEEKNS